MEILNWLIPSLVTIVCCVIPLCYSYLSKRKKCPSIKIIDDIKRKSFDKEIEFVFDEFLQKKEMDERECFKLFEIGIVSIDDIFTLEEVRVNNKKLSLNSGYISPFEKMVIRCFEPNYRKDLIKIETVELVISSNSKTRFLIKLDVKYIGMDCLFNIREITRLRK